MRTCIGIGLAALIALGPIDQRANGLAPQDCRAARVLVETFRASPVFWRQSRIGKQIAGLRCAEVLDSLAPWLNHEDRHIRANVAFIFAALGDRRGLEALAHILNDRSARPEGQGIARGGRWALEPQIRADRYYAVHVLGELRDARGVDLLLPLLTDDEVNYKVAWALGEIGDPRAVRPLIDALGDNQALMRVSAVRALETLGAREALPYLRALLSDQALPSAGEQVPVADTAREAILKLEKQP
jgi:HEAT repeat protein